MIFPINLGQMHWTAAAINFREKRLEYYDSMGDRSSTREVVFQVKARSTSYDAK